MVHRPKLFLVAVDGRLSEATRVQRNVCRESSLRAASPVGDLLRPCSKSQTDDGERPIASPISLSVSPSSPSRSSVMRDAQVFMADNLRDPVIGCQRHSVTGVRENNGMGNDIYPGERSTLAERIAYWRKKRGFATRKALAGACTLSPTAISDLESGRQKGSTMLTSLASALRINANYLQTGAGDPLDLKALPAPPNPNQHLLDLVAHDEVADLTDTELHLVRLRIRDTVREVRALRPKRRQTKTA